MLVQKLTHSDIATCPLHGDFNGMRHCSRHHALRQPNGDFHDPLDNRRHGHLPLRELGDRHHSLHNPLHWDFPGVCGGHRDNLLHGNLQVSWSMAILTSF